MTVGDLDRSIGFYRDVLGFPVSQPVECKGEIFEKLTGVDGAHMKVARVTAPGHILELVQYVNRTSRPESKSLESDVRPNDRGAMHLAFQVQDIESVVAAIAKAGVFPVSAVQTVVDGPRTGVRAVYAKDADGVVFEFIEITRRDIPAGPSEDRASEHPRESDAAALTR